MAKYRARCDGERGGLTQFQLNVLLCVFVLSGHVTDVAVAYLSAAHAQRRRQQTEVLDPRQFVEERYLEAKIDWLVALESPSDEASPKIQRIRSVAQKFVSEHQAAAFVARSNLKGAAPSSRQVCTGFCAGLDEIGGSGLLSGLQRSAYNSVIQKQHGRWFRRWCAGFRRRWGIKIGFLRAKPKLSVEEEAAKEPCFD